MNNCCDAPEFKCTDSRAVNDYRRRRYKCRSCGDTFSTMETRVVYSKGINSQRDAKKSAFGSAAAEELHDLKHMLRILLGDIDQ